MARYILATPPAGDVVTTAEAKAHLRVTDASLDAQIAGTVAAVVQHLDGRAGILGRALLTQTWMLQTAGPDCRGRIALELPIVHSIVSVVVLVEGVPTPWTGFRLAHEGLRAVVMPTSGESWPSSDDREDAVTVTFVAGYGDAASVPAPIRHAILLMVGDLNRFATHDADVTRETVEGVGTIELNRTDVGRVALTRTVDMLLAPYRVFPL